MGRESKKKIFPNEVGDLRDIESGNNNNNSKAQQLLLQNNNKLKLAQQEAQLISTQPSDNSAEKEDSHNTMSYCFRKKWVLLVSMIFTLLITAVVVAMLTVTLLEDEDQCPNNFPFQQPSYKLFATKTAYSTARNYIASPTQQTNYDKLPDIFSKSDSLKALNERQKSLGCKVRQLHYFGRHAARFPNTEGIDEMNKLMTKIQARIDLSKSSPNIKPKNTTNNVCNNPLAPYKQWTSFMIPEQDNLVMDSGFEETMAIAKRFKSIYPEMFDSNQSKIDFGVTEEFRTAQTALTFLRNVDNFPLDFCKIDQFPMEAPFDKKRAAEITSNSCYKSFLERFRKEKLYFHKQCEALNEEDFVLQYKFKSKEPDVIKSISASVSEKLKLSDEDQLKDDETKAIYKVCQFQSALSGSSIWCNLFSEKDLRFYEYLEDIDDFFNQAFGDDSQYQSACPVTTVMMKDFMDVQSGNPSRSQPEAYFYFTHSEVIQKILAASVALKNDPEYSDTKISNHLQARTIPTSRRWRASLFTPFSGNLAFTLYECPRPDRPNKTIQFEVVASLNEQPIRLGGCSGFVCSLDDLIYDGRIFKTRTCEMGEFCKKRIVLK